MTYDPAEMARLQQQRELVNAAMWGSPEELEHYRRLYEREKRSHLTGMKDEQRDWESDT